MANVGSWEVLYEYFSLPVLSVISTLSIRYITHLYKYSVTAEQVGSRKYV